MTAKQNIVTQLLRNLPSFTVMPDGKFLALEYKTERIIAGSINDITHIEFPMLPNTNSKGDPHMRRLVPPSRTNTEGK